MCDSIVTLSLIDLTPTGSQSGWAICPGESYSFGGQMLTTAGTYFDTLMNAAGCDSIVTLFLAVQPTQTTNLSATICQGETLGFAGQLLDATGTYYDTLATVFGCDSIVAMSLTVNPTATSSYNDEVCEGIAYVFGGQTLWTSGTYNDTLTGPTGWRWLIVNGQC